jgi:hypothetical protein
MKSMSSEERQLFLKGIIETTSEELEHSASPEQSMDVSKEPFLKQIITLIRSGGDEIAFVWVGICLLFKVIKEEINNPEVC